MSATDGGIHSPGRDYGRRNAPSRAAPRTWRELDEQIIADVLGAGVYRRPGWSAVRNVPHRATTGVPLRTTGGRHQFRDDFYDVVYTSWADMARQLEEKIGR